MRSKCEKNNKNKVHAAKKMQQQEKSKHRTLMTKTLMIRTLKIRGISAINHLKKNVLIEIIAVGKEKHLCI